MHAVIQRCCVMDTHARPTMKAVAAMVKGAAATASTTPQRVDVQHYLPFVPSLRQPMQLNSVYVDSGMPVDNTYAGVDETAMGLPPGEATYAGIDDVHALHKWDSSDYDVGGAVVVDKSNPVYDEGDAVGPEYAMPGDAQATHVVYDMGNNDNDTYATAGGVKQAGQVLYDNQIGGGALDEGNYALTSHAGDQPVYDNNMEGTYATAAGGKNRGGKLNEADYALTSHAGDQPLYDNNMEGTYATAAGGKNRGGKLNEADYALTSHAGDQPLYDNTNGNGNMEDTYATAMKMPGSGKGVGGTGEPNEADYALTSHGKAVAGLGGNDTYATATTDDGQPVYALGIAHNTMSAPWSVARARGGADKNKTKAQGRSDGDGDGGDAVYADAQLFRTTHDDDDDEDGGDEEGNLEEVSGPSSNAAEKQAMAAVVLLFFLAGIVRAPWPCCGDAVIEYDDEREGGALHINTSDPVGQHVFINGVDMQQLHDLVQTQASMLAAQESANVQLRATDQRQHQALCRRFPPVADSAGITNVGIRNRDWHGAVLANNGKIYGIPNTASNVLVIDPAANTTDTIPLTGVTNGGTKWASGVLRTQNGLIYGIPHDATAVLIIDPSTNTADTTTLASPPGGAKWNSGILADNGLIYAIPWRQPAVLIIDPATNTTDATSIAGLTFGDRKWYGGVQARNGLIYCIPHDEDYVLIIDPATNAFDTTSITGLPSAGLKWWGGVLAGNGLIYGIPSSETSVLIIDPATNTVDTTSISGLPVGPSKWLGAVPASGRGGRIVGIPSSASSVLIVDTITGTADATSLSVSDALVSDDKWWNGALAPNGLIYALPQTSNAVLVIGPGC
ncbi:hypothetical protein PTSG_10641 [Salpingoeca rosetta]|uniref:Uncharacterized protein n=1 Tax=Salpingoeca rosetta (strain ATCC 50818 / BSB-021) TaxID=946362 RepID=F2URY2_SALR5|nr:uncharacterized protein PTSG_10641 [Salpingoeca rosetta]EGD80387.1 hypothetical protein PTSG_10641 [Salpingoeca rosetta]|eukprot:XP_004988177.1 hypothetical protein PTSG_10641 [Salpingoeca rosetta]